jgi:DNA invertase Pin-like site-specific DNA recombinase
MTTITKTEREYAVENARLRPHTDAAIWLRVSTEEQREENQLPDLRRFCRHHGYRIAARYEVEDSAWKGGVGGPEYQAAIQQALDAAWRGEFSVLVVWALDRITRKGAEDALRIFREFHERGCTVLSVKEPWLSGSPEIAHLLLAFAGWNAEQFSNHRSEQIKAGIARARAEGKQIGGRKPGAKDRRPRRTEGYRNRQRRAS